MKNPFKFAVIAALAAGVGLYGMMELGNAGSHGHHGGHGHGHAAHSALPSDESASTRAYIEANNKMHEGMDIAFTGNADVDFARGMIPHHEGAIDMARIVLEYGADPELRKLAEEIIAAQEDEIAFLRSWLEANAPR